MSSAQPLIIEPLDSAKHDRAGFECGVPELNAYLAGHARKECASGVAMCFVAIEDTSPERILEYYTLSAASINRTALPDAILKKLPRYRDLPATLLGRLAVSVETQGSGLGRKLLFSAVHRAVQASADVASLAFVTDPKDENARSFYRRFGFRDLDEGRVYLLMKDIGEIVNAR